MQTYRELKSLTKKELIVELATARDVMMKKRITVKTKHDKDSSAINKQKKYIARLSTALKELELEELVDKSNEIA